MANSIHKASILLNLSPKMSFQRSFFVVSACSWMQLTISFQYTTRLITNLLSGKEFQVDFKGALCPQCQTGWKEGDEGGCAYCARPTDPGLRPGCGAPHELERKQRAWAGTHRGLSTQTASSSSPYRTLNLLNTLDFFIFDDVAALRQVVDVDAGKRTWAEAKAPG